MPNQFSVVVAPDPLWFLKFLLAALLLSVPLTIGARLVKARRHSITLTFVIALAALLAGHFVIAPISASSWVILVALVAVLTTLCLGIRYLLVTSALASFSIAVAMVVFLVAGLIVVIAVERVAGVA
jgi:hypothetical protein